MFTIVCIADTRNGAKHRAPFFSLRCPTPSNSGQEKARANLSISATHTNSRSPAHDGCISRNAAVDLALAVYYKRDLVQGHRRLCEWLTLMTSASSISNSCWWCTLLSHSTSIYFSLSFLGYALDAVCHPDLCWFQTNSDMSTKSLFFFSFFFSLLWPHAPIAFIRRVLSKQETKRLSIVEIENEDGGRRDEAQ